MATIDSRRIVEERVVLSLSIEEAAYLHDLLYRHVGGALVHNGQPLGNVVEKLSPLLSPDEKGIYRAYNSKRGYASLYRDPSQVENY